MALWDDITTNENGAGPASGRESGTPAGLGGPMLQWDSMDGSGPKIRKAEGPVVRDSGQNEPAQSGPAADGAPSDWRTTLPEDLKGHESLGGFSNVGDLVRDFLKLQETHGDRPNPPASAGEYEITAPEGMTINKEAFQSFLQTAHQAGLTQDQVNALVAFNAAEVQTGREARSRFLVEAYQNGKAQLRREWGPEYGRNLSLAQRAVEALAEDDVKQYMRLTGLDNDPAVVRLFARIGRLMGEDVLVNPDGVRSDPVRRGPGGMPMLFFPSME
jgi:hypothetical protein